MYNYQTPTKKTESPMRQRKNGPMHPSGFAQPQRLPSPQKQPLPANFWSSNTGGYKPTKRVMTAYGKAPNTRPAQVPLSARTRPHQPSPVRARISPVRRSLQAPTQSSTAKKSSYIQALKNSQNSPARQRTVRRQLESQQDWNTGTHRVYPGTPAKKTEGNDPRVPRSAVNAGEQDGLQFGFSQKMSLGGDPNMFQWNTQQPHRESFSPSKRQSTLKTDEIQWTEEEVKQSRAFCVKHINLEQNAYEDNEQNWKVVGKNDKTQTWATTKCGPSCQTDHMHRFEYDFTKNYKDHISQRPGIDFVLDPKIDVEEKKALDRGHACDFGRKQTPINLSTKMPVLKDFKDKEFSFHYNEINQKAQ